MNLSQSSFKNSSNKHNPYMELKPRITVVGVGGAGGNAVNNMIRSKLEGVEFIVCNTDSQALGQSLSERRIQLGMVATRGLGAGSRPEVGRIAAEEALEEVVEHVKGSNMLFITAGMGGGTGTGAGPVIAKAARDMGVLTVGVVTKPFHFEGAQRMRLAEKGIEELQQYVDTLIIIPNQNLFRIANEKTTFADAFKLADDVLYSGVRGVTDLMIMPGLINLDFADVRSVMGEMGKAMMGTGEAKGERRAIDSAEAAISNPLLDDVSMRGARGVLINITGGFDMTLFEVDEAANRIREEVDAEAQIIFGSTFDEKMEGSMRVSVVATGIDVQNSHTFPHHQSQLHTVSTPSSVPSGNATSAPDISKRSTKDSVQGFSGMASTAPTMTNLSQMNEIASQEKEDAAHKKNEDASLSDDIYETSMTKTGPARKKKIELEEEEDTFSIPTSKSRASEKSSFSEKYRRIEEISSKKPSFLERLTGISFSNARNPISNSSVARFVQEEEEKKPLREASQKQATLPGIEPHETEDNIEIPAFLRRNNTK